MPGDRFELYERLGEGGLGVVHRARDLASGRDVALKLLRPEASGEEDRLRLKQEFRAMTRLRHPNLCEALDLGSGEDGAPFFTMELVPGHDLAAEIPMAPARLLALLPQLAGALDHLHRQGLVHGDVKPENVRVAPDGTLKLLDLGLLAAAGEVGPTPRGTLAYMAPEVVRGDRVDPRADVYALGAMCYHLLSGKLPFAGTTPLEVLRAHLTRRPRSLRSLDPAIPPILDQAVMMMMACEPVARPSSLAEVLALLDLAPQQDDDRPLTGAFIGRQRELAAFQEVLNSMAREGRGRALWIAGGTGTGKSRLLDELRVLAQLEEVPFFLGRCTDRSAPFGPWVRILRDRLGQVQEALKTASDEQRGALGLLLPELGHHAPDLEPREERVLLQSAIAHVLRALAGRRGAVIALDDWDRADAASSETLAYLRRNEQGVPFAFVVTAREEGYLDPGATALAPLTQAEVAALAGSMLGVAQPPEDFAAALHRWTGGHAGHVQQVVAQLRRTGALQREGGRWAFPADLAGLDLGADFRAMVLAPLAALTKPATQLAELIAVLGAEADLAALVELAGQDEETLFAALDELRARRIVERVGHQVAFSSGGLQDAVYGRMQEGRRLWVHALAAARLERTLKDEPPSDVAGRTSLARHYVRSMQIAKALPATLLAADLNAAVFAMEAARGLLRDGLAMMAAEPERHAVMRRDFLERLAGVERWRGDLDAMTSCLDQAIPLAEQLGEPGPLARLLVLRGASFNQRMTPAALEQSIACLERADALVDPQDEGLRARARFFLGQANFYLGRPEQARRAFEAAIPPSKPAGLAFWRAKCLAFEGYLRATGARAEREEGFGLLAEAAEIQRGLRDSYGLGFTAALQGDALLQSLRLAEAEQATSAQIAVAEELGVNEDLAVGLANLAAVHALAGRHRQALAAAERALEVATQFGYRVGLLVRAVKGYSLAWCGDLRAAASALAAAEEAGRGEAGYMFVHAVPFILEGWLRLGRADEARRVGEDALYLFQASAEGSKVAQTRALLGEALLAGGDPVRAAELAEEAWKGARQAGCPLAEYLALRLRARQALAAGRLEEAGETAAQALARVERAGALGLAAEAAGLLGEVALMAGKPDAAARFRAMQAYADREAVPYLRALALYGEAAVDPDADRGQAVRLEAQQILRSLAEGLEALPRQAFLGSPACARVLAEQHAPVAPMSLDAGPQVFDRIKAVSQDLLGFANQYGAMFREWAATTRQLQLLNELAARINATLELDDILPEVGRLTLELTRAERAFIVLAEDGALRCRTAVGPDGQKLPDPRFSLSICQGVFDSGQPVAVMDASLGDMRASVAELELRTLMCVPLAARGQALGVLYVDSRSVVSSFSSRDLELMAAIAGHASMAIANAVLYAESRRRAEDLEKAFGLYREANRQALTDALTGLNNRRCFDEVAARELETSRREARPLALLLLDVDHFKGLNDTYGHVAGDLALAEVARALQGVARVRDVAARMGGEEFALLCPETEAAAALALAERVRAAVAELRLEAPDGTPLRPITCSIGVATFQAHDAKVTDMVARADTALYACKRNGRNQVQLEEDTGWAETRVPQKAPAERRRGGRGVKRERT